MPHIVMCWELGSDLGHVARMLPLAEALGTRGHRVSFIVREPLAAQRLLDPARYTWLQAPLQTDSVRQSILPTRNLAQVMHNIGFHSEQALAGRVYAWRNLFRLLEPDLLVFDHSPTALMAARGLQLKRILLGTGFGVPPALEPLPPFDAADKGAGLITTEREIAGHINAVLTRLGVERVQKLAELYQADAKLLFTLRELDHYPQREGGEYWGPPLQSGGAAPEWPEEGGKRVFAYLKPFETLPSLLGTLKEAGHSTLIYMSRQDGSPVSSANIRYASKPVDLTRVATESDLVICHSGHGTVSATLLGGKPLLLLPLNIEQRMLSTRVVAAGAGLAAPALKPQGMQQKFLQLLAEPAYTTAARAFAERYTGLKVEQNPGRFTALVERLFSS